MICILILQEKKNIRLTNQDYVKEYFVVGVKSVGRDEKKIKFEKKLFATESECVPENNSMNCSYPELLEMEVMRQVHPQGICAEFLSLIEQPGPPVLKRLVTEYVGPNLHEVLCTYANEKDFLYVSRWLGSVLVSVGLDMVTLAESGWFIYDCLPEKVAFAQGDHTKKLSLDNRRFAW